MPVDIAWDNDEHTVLRVTYREPLASEEILDMMDRCLPYLDAADGPLIGINDMRQVTHIPPDTLAIYPRIARHPARSHPQFGQVIVVINVRFVEVIVALFGKVYGTLRFVHTEEEAQDAVRELLAKRAS